MASEQKNGRAYDLKTLGQDAGENTIYNRVKKSKNRTTGVIVDISDTMLSDKMVDAQLGKIFWSAETRFVDEVVIVRNGSISRVVKRK